MALISTDKSKGKLIMHEELGSKIKYLIRWTNNNSDDYDYMKIKFNPGDNFPLRKTLEMHDLIVIFSDGFHWWQEILSTSFLTSMFVQINWIRYKSWIMIEFMSLKV